MSQTVERGLLILNALAEAGPSTPQLLAEELDLNRTVVHRILHTFLETQIVEKKNGIFRLAPEITRIAHSVERELRSCALIELTNLGESIQLPLILYVRDGEQQAALLSYIPPITSGVRMIPQIGYTSDLSKSPSGLCLIAFGPAATKQQALSKSAQPKKANELIKIAQQQGFSSSSINSDIDFREISVPILVDGVAQACISAFLPDDNDIEINSVIEVLRKCSNQIAENLKHPNENL